jgi:hypothetical protein
MFHIFVDCPKIEMGVVRRAIANKLAAFIGQLSNPSYSSARYSVRHI